MTYAGYYGKINMPLWHAHRVWEWSPPRIYPCMVRALFYEKIIFSRRKPGFCLLYGVKITVLPLSANTVTVICHQEVFATRLLTRLHRFPTFPVFSGGFWVPSAIQHLDSVRDSHPLPFRCNQFIHLFFYCAFGLIIVIVYCLYYNTLLSRLHLSVSANLSHYRLFPPFLFYHGNIKVNGA